MISVTQSIQPELISEAEVWEIHCMGDCNSVWGKRFFSLWSTEENISQIWGNIYMYIFLNLNFLTFFQTKHLLKGFWICPYQAWESLAQSMFDFIFHLLVKLTLLHVIWELSQFLALNKTFHMKVFISIFISENTLSLWWVQKLKFLILFQWNLHSL